MRWDSGVAAGSVVGVHFDPMLAKVIAHAPTRTEAAGRLALTLERLHLGGVITNRAFLAATLRHEEFLAGQTTTDFIERADPDRSLRLAESEIYGAAVSAALWLQGENRDEATTLATMPTGWRNSLMPPQSVTLRLGEDDVRVDYQIYRYGSIVLYHNTGADETGDDGEESESIPNGEARIYAWRPDGIDLEVDGRRQDVTITPDGNRIHVQVLRGTLSFEVLPRFVVPGGGDLTGGLIAPMPGTVLEVRCAVGDAVESGQVLIVMEGMKMEHHVSAPFDGVVTEVRVETGEQLENGAMLLVIEEGESES